MTDEISQHDILEAVNEMKTATAADVMWWLDQKGKLGDANSRSIANRLATLVERKKLKKLSGKIHPKHKKFLTEIGKAKQYTGYALSNAKAMRCKAAILTVTQQLPYAPDIIDAIPPGVVFCLYLTDDKEAERAAWASGRQCQGVNYLTMHTLNEIRSTVGPLWFTSDKLQNAYYDNLAKRRTIIGKSSSQTNS
jgi:hypothetical protein